VYWLELSAPERGAWGARVALDRDTYLPHLMTILDDRGEPTDFEFRFRVLETVPRREADFTEAGKATTGGFDVVPGSGSGASSDGVIGLAAARSALGRPAVWAGPSIAGAGFTQAVLRDVESEPGSAGVRRGKSLALAYGTSVLGPVVRGVVVDQVRDDSPIREAVVDGEPPREGIVELREHTIGWSSTETKRTTAVLRRDGLWIVIDAPDQTSALEVAKALRPIP
jgi:hypothetical protein